MPERSPVPRPSSDKPAPRAVAAPAPATRPPRSQRIAARRARRRQVIAGLLPAQALLALIVIAGMITGAHTSGTQGPATGTTVFTVELSGAFCLVLLGLGIAGGVAIRRGQGRRFPWWALLSIPMFVFWAALRVSEYTG